MPLTRSRRVGAVAVLAAVMSLAATPAAIAQDPVGESFCALFDPEEVGSVMGEPVEAEPRFGACDWASVEPEGEFVFVSAGWADHTIDERMGFESGTELTVGGRRAWWTPDLRTLYIELDLGVLALGGGTEQQLTELGELAVPRAAVLLAAATAGPATPEPSIAGDAALEALFPESIGGAPVTVSSRQGDEFFPDPEQRQGFADRLAEQGRSFDDVSAAVAFSGEPPYTILAFRVAGGDASVLVPIILALSTEDLEQTPGEIGGKAVTLLTSGSGSGAAYASGEVVWIVQATDPTLTEIISALP